MKDLSKKLKQACIVSLFLILGMGSALLLNTVNAQAISDCPTNICDMGDCDTNGNTTYCASPTGEPPCTETIICDDGGGEKDPQRS